MYVFTSEKSPSLVGQIFCLAISCIFVKLLEKSAPPKEAPTAEEGAETEDNSETTKDSDVKKEKE